jgi:hypothetical protein
LKPYFTGYKLVEKGLPVEMHAIEEVPLSYMEITAKNMVHSENILWEQYFQQLFPGEPVLWHIFLLGATIS